MVHLTSDDFSKVISVTRKHLPLIEKKNEYHVIENIDMFLNRTSQISIPSLIENKQNHRKWHRSNPTIKRNLTKQQINTFILILKKKRSLNRIIKNVDSSQRNEAIQTNF